MRFSLLSILALILTSALAPLRALSDPIPPVHFVDEDFAPDLWFYVPTCLAFLPDGGLLVGEKRGRVYRVTDGIKQQPALWSAEDEVLSSGDCGLMSIAVDPDYSSNRFIYLLYVADPDSDCVDADEERGFGRLARYRVSETDPNQLEPDSRTILMGASWADGPLVDYGSHAVGSLRFGADGSLLVSAGDGASSGGVDAGGLDSTAFTAGRTDTTEDIGAFRAQYLGSLCGKILRIDPATGEGYADNPFYDDDPRSVRSRVWLYGLRNAFRFCVRPGTGGATPPVAHPGAVYTGDVGWYSWEEIDVAPEGGMNFGWPCYEGPEENPPYQQAHPRHHGCETAGGEANPVLATGPTLAWAHDDSTRSQPFGLKGNCAIGGVFYTGSSYPVQYRNAYFFGDFGENWLCAAQFDEAHRVVWMQTFETQMRGPVDLAVDPLGGDLVYVSITTGAVRRIRYAGGDNVDPVAIASAAPDSGRSPLEVRFSSAGSIDPEGGSLAYHWSFGDGGESALPDPLHLYGAGGTYTAVLTVRDSVNALGAATVTVRVTGAGAFPATPVLDDFDRADGPVESDWVDNIVSLAVLDSMLTQTGAPSPSAVWNRPPFGPDQEVYYTLEHIVPDCRRYSLLLKVQGTSSADGAVEVRYDPTLSRVEVSANTSGAGWKLRGAIDSVQFSSGDRFGARAYADGVVQVFRNRSRVGEVTLGSWPFAASGGRVGLRLAGATGSAIEDFGGGTFSARPNTAPVATILSPAPRSFYAEGDTVWLAGSGEDADQPDSTLAYEWRVDLHHNNHVHPEFLVTRERSGYLVMRDHGDGTGVHYFANLIVTDDGWLADSASVEFYAEVDLRPGPVVVSPDPVGTREPTTYRFALYNDGGIDAPVSRWMLRVDSLVFGEGEVRVPAHDSVVVEVVVPPVLEVGAHLLCAVADTLGQVIEVDESNNTSLRELLVSAGAEPDVAPPEFLSGPASEPYGVFAWVRWSTDEPASGRVCFGPGAALEDTVEVPPGSAQAAMLEGLRPGTLYYYRVTAVDLSGNPAEAPIDSFTTQLGPLPVAADLPRVLGLSSARPNPSAGEVAFELALPAAAPVTMAVFDLQGRAVWRMAPVRFEAGRWQLRWPGTDPSGRRASPGVYLARVRAGGKTLLRRFAMVR